MNDVYVRRHRQPAGRVTDDVRHSVHAPGEPLAAAHGYHPLFGNVGIEIPSQLCRWQQYCALLE